MDPRERVVLLTALRVAECKKCGKILSSFIDPRQAFGPEKVIPPSVLAGAKVRTTSIDFSAADG